ncbi:MAG TPA: hypothetical protein PLY36_16340 [Spirochaetota bacterium]|nr:hypothetical protein [Spirochaetota bacterium]
MEKFLISLTGLFFLFTLLQCAGTQKPDPEVVACRNKCETTYTVCFKKAAKNEAKKAACEAVKNKCSSDCEKK